MLQELLDTSNKIKRKVEAIDDVQRQLLYTEGSRFDIGLILGTSVKEYLRPLAKSFLEAKLIKLEMELEGLLKKN